MNTSGRLKIATFNLHHGAPADKYLGSPKLVGEACAALDADILALQEVDRYVWRSGFRDLAEIAAGATGMEMYFAKTMFDQGGMYGNALLVRGKIQDVEIIALGDDHKSFDWRGRQYNYMREPRNAIVANAVVRGGEIAVAASHLGGKERQKQLATALSALACRPGPHVMLGDLNLQEGRVRKCLPPTMALPDGPATYAAPDPWRSIDHIAVGGLEVLAVDAKHFPISDHLARIVEVKWPITNDAWLPFVLRDRDYTDVCQ